MRRAGAGLAGAQCRYAPGMTDSIFSKIIRGEIPAQRVYEDDHVIAIMDLNPLSEGHVLVVPKEPAETMADLSDEAAAALGRVLPRITRAVQKVTGAEAVNILQNNGDAAGQVVMHVHIHVIPRFPDREAGGLRVDWRATKGDPEVLADVGRHLARLL
jgi:histidine triad (HIT) family protein